MRVLVTGGAGFIGTHLTRRLVREGCSVTVLDSFSSQVHGTENTLPADIQGHVRLEVADVRDRIRFAKALQDQDVIVHFAAETGTGQSMYEVLRYQEVNIGGTAVLADCLINDRPHRLEKIILASSRAVYGEGRYHCPQHGTVYPGLRKGEDMRAGRFEPLCPTCHQDCLPQPTDENSPLQPTSFYGLSKQVQEQMLLMFAKSLELPCFALRYQNVYGPGQSLKNAYTGILAIFSTQARVGGPINIFEDGEESRDFVYIDDVVDATWRCISKTGPHYEAVNVGSGERVSVSQVVQQIVSFFGSDSEVSVSGAFREGDIRHNVADLTKMRAVLGFEPKWHFRDGLREFLTWASPQEQAPSGYESSLRELRDRGLLRE